MTIDIYGMPKCFDWSLNGSMPLLAESFLGYELKVFSQRLGRNFASTIRTCYVRKIISPVERKKKRLLSDIASIGIQTSRVQTVVRRRSPVILACGRPTMTVAPDRDGGREGVSEGARKARNERGGGVGWGGRGVGGDSRGLDHSTSTNRMP